MTTLSPQARAFVETVQSAALHQNHRARIWAQLQQRVAESSPETTPLRWRASRVPLGWVSCIASVALIAGVLGAVHRQDTSTSVTSANTCPPAPACEACLAPPALEAQSPQPPACEACLAPPALEAQSPQLPPPALQAVSKQVSPTRPKAKPRAPQPVASSISSKRRLDPAQLAPQRLATVLPAYGSVPLENGRERQVPSDPGFSATSAAFYSAALPLGGTTEWLEIAPQLIGAPSPLVESRFESSRPLKLTPPQFRLTATLLE